ncbi:MAG: hypothetical protein NW226_24685 [Microscillaceae bacterium]|nr:hypothetical protein [Microscillaceae bacterium]
MIEILHILTRSGVIEPIMITAISSLLINNFFRLRMKRVELQKLKIELLKSQSDLEIHQRLENLEGIITAIDRDLELIKTEHFKN